MTELPIVTTISQALVDNDPDVALVGDVIVIAEVYGEDGEMGMLSLVSDNLSLWKEMGMLVFREQVLRAVVQGSGPDD